MPSKTSKSAARSARGSALSKEGPSRISAQLYDYTEPLGLTMDLYTDGSGAAGAKVMVVTVRKGSAAARSGLKVGQIISRVDGKVVKHPSKCVAIIGALRKKKQTQIDFDIEGTLSAAQVKARNKVVSKAKRTVKKSFAVKQSSKEKLASKATHAKVKAAPPAVSTAARVMPAPMPTRPPTAYLLYVAERRPQIQAAHPGLPFAKLRKIAGELCKTEWAALSKSRAKKYEKKAADLKVAYEKELIAYFSNEQNQSMANPFGKVHVTRKLKAGADASGEFLASFKRKVRKSRRSRRDPNMPKRPQSAYILFVNELRPKLLKKDPSRPFLELAKECGRQWKSISKKDKAKFDKLAASAKAKYEKDIKAYRASAEHQKWQQEVAERDAKAEEIRRREAAVRARTRAPLPADATEAEIKADKRRRRKERRQAKDPNMPKRFKSAFLFFVADNRDKIGKRHPNASFVDVGRICGKEWKALSSAQKKKYHTKAAKDKADYQKRLAVYMQSATRKTWEAEREAVRKAVEEVDSKFVASAIPSRNKRGFTSGFTARVPIRAAMGGKRVSVKRDPNMPKRPKSAYNIFTSNERAGVLRQNKGRPQHEIETILGTRWKKLSTAQRNKYEAQAKQAREGHQAALQEYLASATRKQWENSVAALANQAPGALPRGLASVDHTVKLPQAKSSIGLVLKAFAGTGTKWSWLRGVAVVLVASGAAADLAGIKPGQIVTHINGNAVSDPNLAAHELSRAKASGETSLTLSISPRTVPKKVLAKMASEALADRRGLKNMYVPSAATHDSGAGGVVRELRLKHDDEPFGLVLGDAPAGQRGALVDSINSKAAGAAAKFQKGDIVETINGVKVKSGGDAVKVMTTLRSKGVVKYVFGLAGGKKKKRKAKAPAGASGKRAKLGRRDV